MRGRSRPVVCGACSVTFAPANRSWRAFSVGANTVNRPVSTVPLDPLSFDPTPDPADAFERQEIQRAVWDAMEQLTPKQRAVAVLRYYLNYSEAETAAYLTLPAGTVKWRLHAARERLQKLLTPFRNEAGSGVGDG